MGDIRYPVEPLIFQTFPKKQKDTQKTKKDKRAGFGSKRPNCSQIWDISYIFLGSLGISKFGGPHTTDISGHR